MADGQEQAAEVSAWGLMDEPFYSQWVRFEPCDQLAEAFELLTGIAPLHDDTDHCDSGVQREA